MNPTNEERSVSDLDLVYVGNKTDVIMIEGAADELSEDEFVKSLHFAQENVAKLVAMQEELIAKAGKEKREVPELIRGKARTCWISAYEVARRPYRRCHLHRRQKVERGKAVEALREEVEQRDILANVIPMPVSSRSTRLSISLQKKAFRISYSGDRVSAATDVMHEPNPSALSG